MRAGKAVGGVFVVVLGFVGADEGGETLDGMVFWSCGCEFVKVGERKGEVGFENVRMVLWREGGRACVLGS
jgi:hypothetical protein